MRHSPKILSPFIGGLADAKVSALIDQEHKTWKEEVIDANLLSFEAAMFKKKNSLYHMDQADTLTWTFNHMGKYLIQSGYKFLQ